MKVAQLNMVAVAGNAAAVEVVEENRAEEVQAEYMYMIAVAMAAMQIGVEKTMAAGTMAYCWLYPN